MKRQMSALQEQANGAVSSAKASAKALDEARATLALLQRQSLDDKARIQTLEAQSRDDKARIQKLEAQSRDDKARIQALEAQSRADKERIRTMAAQTNDDDPAASCDDGAERTATTNTAPDDASDIGIAAATSSSIASSSSVCTDDHHHRRKHRRKAPANTASDRLREEIRAFVRQSVAPRDDGFVSTAELKRRFVAAAGEVSSDNLFFRQLKHEILDAYPEAAAYARRNNVWGFKGLTTTKTDAAQC